MAKAENHEFDTHTPKREPESWLTPTAARAQAADCGCLVEYMQFRRWLEWELLPQPTDGRFPPSIVERLVRIVEQGRKTTALERRVLVLGSEFRDPPVPSAKLRQAMEALIPKIRAKARILRTVHESLSQLGGEFQALPPRKRRWTPPATADDWLTILHGITEEHFESRREALYIWTSMLRSRFPDRFPAAIPDEELFTAVVVRDAAMRGGQIREG